MKLDIRRVREADAALGTFAAAVGDLRPFWSELGEHLADEAQRRWPLRRRTGTLRRSLTWAGTGLKTGGIFESSPNRLEFGTSVFYGRFAQYGTRKQRARPVIHIDEADIGQRLTEWARGRVADAGLEVDQ